MKLKTDVQWRWLVALGGILMPGIVFGAFSVPHTFEAGTPIKAAEMNANFAAIAAELDAAAEAPAAPVIGSLTLAGLTTSLPFTKFSQSVAVTWLPGTSPSKPKLSDIVIHRSASADALELKQAMLQGKVAATGSIVLGSLVIGLEEVRVTEVSVVDVRGGMPQEAIQLIFQSITWEWDDGVNPVTRVSFDIGSGAASGAAGDAFSFGYFPPGVTPDASYAAVSGYDHRVGCATPAAGCKPAHGALLVSKAVSLDTLTALGAAVTARSTTVALDWFSAEATVNSSVELDGSRVTEVTLSTSSDGTLTESSGFTYPRITWQDGNSVLAWDVIQNAPL